ncbi:hypothetical protein [Catenuloplanes indicus]|uniref:Uncharacterized protein n=1 Tax=Catenuloplanes indicus TaxID=137267 RepID=A0AAE3VT35_9ACTN|nr:hypothetical protein [Catenuloplanes indicus]MDQ0363398.1 hypothetical protein [Catenuloplanes indicus]
MTTPRTDTQRLADAAEALSGNADNGPWRTIEDPRIRSFVAEHVIGACRDVAKAAGLDDVAAECTKLLAEEAR